MTPTLVDFHVHYLGPQWSPTVSAARSATGLSRINDLDDVLAQTGPDKVDVRVLNAPPALVGHGGPLPPAVISRVNDHLAGVVHDHPDQLRGLATIDLWQGTAAAEEIRRAVTELGLPGVVVDAAADRGDRLLDDNAVRPGLFAAAELDVPVFVHPVYPGQFLDQVSGLGRPGVLLARGAITAASLMALFAAPWWAELGELRVVTPLISAPVILGAGFGAGVPPNLWFDTMGFHPGTIRYLVDTVGADHVVVGSDSPIVADSLNRAHAIGALRTAGLDGAELDAVAGGTALALLGQRVAL